MFAVQYAKLPVSIFTAIVVLLCIFSSGCTGHPQRAAQANAQQAANNEQMALMRQGKLIFDETPKYAPEYVGNKLSCNDCHIQSGTAPYAAPMIDIAEIFPMFNKRAGHVISLQNRIQECFSRSEAGKPLPEDSSQMKALMAYLDWLSRNGVKGRPYKERGFV